MPMEAGHIHQCALVSLPYLVANKTTKEHDVQMSTNLNHAASQILFNIVFPFLKYMQNTLHVIPTCW